MSAALSPAERHLRAFMMVCAALYAAGGVGFLGLNDHLLVGINRAGVAMGFEATALGDRFWLALAGSMMLTIATCSYFVARDVRRYRQMCVPVIVSKAVSTAAGLVLFFAGRGAFACLLVAITDFPLFVATWWLYRRARPPAP